MAELPDTNTSPSPSPVPTSTPAPTMAEPGQTTTPGDPPPVRPPSTPVSPPAPPSPKSKGPKWLFGIIIGVLIIAVGVAVAAHFLKTTKSPTVVTKKDIPVLTYGLVNNGGVPQYPITYPYSNDTVYIALQLFEGLVGYQGQTKIVPLLATSWSNPKDTTWVFNLRQGVKFHSGRTMTAQDVKYTLDYAVAHQSDAGNPTFIVTSAIKQIDVTGPYQVTITTTSPDAVLLNQLSLIGIVDSKAKLGDYNAGTGPYTVKPGTTPTTTSIDLVASNNYWGGHVYTREVQISLSDNADQLASDTALGKFDLAGYFNTAQLAKIKHYQAVNVPDQGLNYIGLNTERVGSPLQSLAARQAVAYALDIPAIIKAAGLQGEQASQIVPLLLPGHNPAISNAPYDPTKAKQLLATVKNASSPLTFAYSSTASTQVDEMVKELTAVGFNIKPVSVSDFNALVNDTLAGKYDLFTESDTSATVDGRDILNDLLIGNQDYDSPQIDSLIAQAGGTLNPASRINQMQQIATIVDTDKPIIPLYTQTRTYALTKPYVVKTDLPSLDTSIYFWKVYQE